MTAQSKVIVLLALLGAAGFVMVGGDVLPENNAERLVGTERSSEGTGCPVSRAGKPVPAMSVSAPYQDCQRIVRGRQLRWQVAHFGDVEKLRIDCSYDSRGELQL